MYVLSRNNITAINCEDNLKPTHLLKISTSDALYKKIFAWFNGSDRYKTLGFRNAISCLIRADNNFAEEPENNRRIKPLMDN